MKFRGKRPTPLLRASGTVVKVGSLYEGLPARLHQLRQRSAQAKMLMEVKAFIYQMTVDHYKVAIEYKEKGNPKMGISILPATSRLHRVQQLYGPLVHDSLKVYFIIIV